MKCHIKRTSPVWLGAANSTEGGTADQKHGERQDWVHEGTRGAPEEEVVTGTHSTVPDAWKPGLCRPGEGYSWKRKDQKEHLPFRWAHPALTSHTTHTALGQCRKVPWETRHTQGWTKASHRHGHLLDCLSSHLPLLTPFLDPDNLADPTFGVSLSPAPLGNKLVYSQL